MKFNLLATAVAASALAVAGAASAQLVGGAVGGAVGGSVSGPGVGVPSVSTPPINTPSTPALPRVGAPAVTPPNATLRGSADANANAGPASASASAGANLDALATGMAVKDSAGRTVGRVTEVLRTKAGKVQSIVVDQAGRAVTYGPGSLSLSGNVVTTTEATAEAR